MGTRADFYVGRGKDAEWLGSIAWDGHPDSIPEGIRTAKDSSEFRDRVAGFLSARDDATTAKQGWPWPWNDSRTTDYSYAYEGGQVYGTSFGRGWWPADRPEPEEDPTDAKVDFPDMSARSNFVPCGKRSGVILLRG